MLFSRVKISCLRAKAHLVFHWCLDNKRNFSSSNLVLSQGFVALRMLKKISRVSVANEQIFFNTGREISYLQAAPATSLIFPRPPMVAFRRDDNLRTSLVHTAEKQATTRAGTYPCQHPRCRTCGHISSETDLLGPKDRLTIKESFTCLSSGLIYCISCRRCPAITSARLGAL